MEIDSELRNGVIKSLPEAINIADVELRGQVYDAWVLSLSKSSFKKIEDIPAKGGPETPAILGGTQADHLNGVARIAVAMVAAMKETIKSFQVDLDEVRAGGLCHDLGKAFEFDPENRKRWSDDPAMTGLPSMRHTLYGVHIALSAGLPEKIAHIAGAHSPEGEFIIRSLACDIVRLADEAFWHLLGKGGNLEGDVFDWQEVVKKLPKP